ncbi:sensor histidine kinase [Demequina mangrovi]|uniref:histidine kinase n=1 Tax=Demequina mangrovi TaxID=1043493 RepID=A0A1H7AM37_9MICO|nr:HAMP domain-containing sensor histidine kinase [Demequina mangrovi]SEJ66711.1 Signal transduction histidine kinase [Demequina mangrovi]
MTIRVKLTAMFALLFVVLAGVLVTTAYLFVASATTPEAQQADRQQLLEEALADQGLEIPEPAGGPSPMPSGGPGDAIGQALTDIAAQARANVLNDLLTRSLLAFALSAVVAVALAWWLAGRVLRPVDRIARAASTLSERTLDRRLPEDGPDDEFGRLSRAFNGMLARLEAAFDARQRFAADASHELRTPLAVLRASADNVLSLSRPSKQARELAEEVEIQVERADSLMSSLLTLARADDVIHTREAVDLADVAADVVSAASPRATELGVAIDLEIEDAPVLGDPVLLERLVANLLDNALRYNLPEQGWVRCRVRGEDGHALVEIANSGPELEAGDIPALFRRFSRGGQRSEVAGHGLGLPIVARVAQVHEGAVDARPGSEGGLSVRVSLPLRPSA